MPTVPNQYLLLPVICTAKKWERAAIVYAYVGEGKPYTAEEFAAIGIYGLSSKQFVEKYRAKWQAAIDEGAARPVAIGDEFFIPPLFWGTTGNAHKVDCTCGCWDR